MQRRILKFLSFVGLSLALVASLVVLAISGSEFLTSNDGRKSKPTPSSTSSGEITHINGTKLSDRKITRAGGYIVMPRVIYPDGQPMDSTLEKNAITAGLTSADALNAWGLCEAELQTQAEAFTYYATSIERFPENLPFHRAKKDGSVSAEDAALAEKFRQEAKRYDAAAKLAKRADVLCVTPGRPLNTGNYAYLTARGDLKFSGTLRAVEIPDTEVVDATLEYLNLEGTCVREAQKVHDRLVRLRVDTKPGKYGTLSTVTQRSRANGIKRWELRTELLKKEGTHIPCAQ